jgi:hypothetical protein
VQIHEKKSKIQEQVQQTRMNLKIKLCFSYQKQKKKEIIKIARNSGKIGALTFCERAEQKTLIELFSFNTKFTKIGECETGWRGEKKNR